MPGRAETEAAAAAEVNQLFEAAIERFEISGGGAGAYEALIDLEKAEKLARERGVQLPEARLEKVRAWGVHPGVPESLLGDAEYHARHGDVENTTKFLYLAEQAAHWGRTKLDFERVRRVRTLLSTQLGKNEFGSSSN